MKHLVKKTAFAHSRENLRNPGSLSKHPPRRCQSFETFLTGRSSDERENPISASFDEESNQVGNPFFKNMHQKVQLTVQLYNQLESTTSVLFSCSHLKIKIKFVIYKLIVIQD